MHSQNMSKPFVVRNGALFRGHNFVNEPTIIIGYKDNDFKVIRVGSRRHIERCYDRYVFNNKSHKLMACITLNSNVPVEFVCSIFNAHANSVSCSNVCSAMLEENPEKLARNLVMLQAAGY